MQLPRRWKIFLLVTLISIVADQATKIWARESLPVRPVAHVTEKCSIPDDIVKLNCAGQEKVVIDGYWDWRLSFNPGSAFGLFNSASGARIFLSIIGVLAVVGMGFMLKKTRDDQTSMIWALGLVAGGAIGNLIDRVYYGVVTDFVLWHLPAKNQYGHYKTEWPVFNVADVALVVGVALMFFQSSDKKKAKAN